MCGLKRIAAAQSHSRNISAWHNAICLVALLLATLFPSSIAPVLSAAQTQDIRPLSPETPQERELAGGQSHQYELTLSANDFVKLTVEQRGIDIALKVTGPTGQALLEGNSADGTDGSEEVALVAETVGAYRLTISASAKDAPMGRYELKATAPRAATPQDRAEAAGQRRAEEAMRLYAQGTKEKLEEALKHLLEARVHFQSANNPASEGNALNLMGIISLTRGEARNAVEYLKQAWELARDRGEPQSKAALLNNLAVAHSQLGQAAQAAEYMKQALPLMQAAQDKGGEAKILTSLGSVHQMLGQFQQALDYLQRALASFRTLNDKGSEGVIHNNLGTLYRHLGEPEKSLDAYQQALPLLRAAGNKRTEAITLDNLGVLLRATGNLTGALERFNQALVLRRELGDKRGEAITLDNIGVTHRELGDTQKALEHHTQALPLLQAAGDTLRTGLTLNNLGRTYRQHGDLTQALEHHRQALPLIEAAGDRSAQADVLKNIAWIECEQGQLTAARSAIEQAITLLEFIRSNVNSQEARALFLATVTDYYELNTDILMRLHEREPQAGHAAAALQISQQARARSLLELLNEAQADLRQGVDAQLLERERTLKQRLTTKLDALSRTLNSKASDAQKIAAKKEVSDLTDEYRQAQAAIRKASPRHAALTQPQPLSTTEIQRLLDTDTLLLEYALGEKASYLWAVTPASVTSYRLPPRAELEAAARKVYASLTARQLQAGLTDAQQRARVQAAEAAFPAQAAALSRMLLEAVAAQLSKKRLAIVAGDALAYLPFAALPDPADQTQPLLAAHEIVNLPSASVLAVIRHEGAETSTKAASVAVFADPVFEANDPRVLLARKGKPARALPNPAKLPAPKVEQTAELGRALRSFTDSTSSPTRTAGLTRLPFSREEAETIEALAPAHQVLKATGFAASRTAAMSSDLGRYRYLHFATHGLLNAQHPELSGLVFSLVNEAGQPQDGFLRLHEIYNLRLAAEVVVLSACQTALGKEVRGEGLIGLTRGFMHAGAPRVVASLWQVDDLATAELMKRFYAGMLKENLRPAAALRAAQLALLKQKPRSAPFYWAAFVLQGEWQ
jgi:CHAT domain-containing protein/tetratricopeptide (TPR) repeat protein